MPPDRVTPPETAPTRAAQSAAAESGLQRPTGVASGWWQPLALWLSVLAVGAVLLVRSWRKWCDILVDYGHELYIPWRLSEGELLYRDIAFSMGPLSQSYHALLFRVFGVSQTTLIVSNLLVLALIVWMLVRLFSDEWQTPACQAPKKPRVGAFGLAVFFLAVFAVSQDRIIANYNYMAPYRHETTHGLALGLAAILLWIRHLANQRLLCALGASLCTGLTLLTKLEAALPALGVVAAVALLATTRNRSWVWRRLPACVALTLLPLAVAWLTLATVWNPADALSALTLNVRLAMRPELTSQSGFYRALGGWDAPEVRLLDMTLLWLGAISLGLVLLLADQAAGRSRWSRRVGFLVGMSGCLYLGINHLQNVPQLLPAFLVLSLVWLVIRSLRGRVETRRLLLTLFAALLALKLGLNSQWGHYGFVLAMPATLLFIEWLTLDIPAARRTEGRGYLWQGVCVGCAAAIAVTSAWNSDRIYQQKIVTVGKGGDLFHADGRNDDRVLACVNLLDEIAPQMQPDDTLLVVPEGAMLNYLLRHRNPTRYLIASPWEVLAHGGEKTFWSEIQSRPADVVITVTMDMSIHGVGDLGSEHYGGSFVRYLTTNYKPLADYQSRRPDGRTTFRAIAWKRMR